MNTKAISVIFTCLFTMQIASAQYDYAPGTYEYQKDPNRNSGWGSTNYTVTVTNSSSHSDNHSTSSTKTFSIDSQTNLSTFDDNTETKNISRYTCSSYSGDKAGLDDVLVTGYINGRRTKCISNDLFITYYKLNRLGRFDEIPLSVFEDMYLSDEEKAKILKSQEIKSIDIEKNKEGNKLSELKTAEVEVKDVSTKLPETMSANEEKKEDVKKSLYNSPNSNLNEQFSDFRKYIDTNSSYTEDLKAEGIEGLVNFKITISKTGALSSIRITKTDNPKLNEKAIKIIKAYSWKPITKNGEPVPMAIHYSIGFFDY